MQLKAALERQLRRETDPRRRTELMSRWNDLGGYAESKRKFQTKLLRKAGQEAHMRGEPASANPYLFSVWGRGRQWKEGWKSVEQNVRWLRRQQVSARRRI